MPVPPPLAPELATSSLAYLFSDHVAPLVAAGKKGHQSWASGAVVSTHELAVRLGMVAVWGLRETGIIALEPYEAKRLMVKTHGVHAHLLGPPPPHNGIENKILTQWFRGTFAPSGEDVGQGFRWIPMSTNPHAVVLAEAINDVVACGALNRVPLERGVGQRPRGTPATQMQPLPDRIDALRERAEAFRGRWTQFAHTETALFAALEKTIATNIRRRTQRETDTDTDTD